MALRAFLIVVLLTAAGGADAQMGRALEGRLAAFALEPIPATAAFEADILDDSDLHLRLAETMTRALAARMRAASGGSDPTYVLSFDTQDILSLEGDGGGMGELVIDTARGVSMRMNLWSSTRDALLSGRSRRRGVTILRLDMVARDRGDDRVVWQAQAFCEPAGVERSRVYDQMMLAVLNRLGESVEAEIFVVVN